MHFSIGDFIITEGGNNMVNKKNDICPLCGGKLQSRGKVKRLLRIENGEKIFIKIPRYSCKDCGHWHRVIPDNVIPYKHYRKDIYEGFKSGELSSENVKYEDFPSEATQNRWKHLDE